MWCIVCVLFLSLILAIVIPILHYLIHKPILRIAVADPVTTYSYTSLFPTENGSTEFRMKFEFFKQDIAYLFNHELYYHRHAYLLELKENGELYGITGLRVYDNNIKKPLYITIPSAIRRVKLDNAVLNNIQELIRQTYPSHGDKTAYDASERMLWWVEYPDHIIREDAIPPNNGSGINQIYEILYNYLQ